MLDKLFVNFLSQQLMAMEEFSHDQLVFQKCSSEYRCFWHQNISYSLREMKSTRSWPRLFDRAWWRKFCLPTVQGRTKNKENIFQDKKWKINVSSDYSVNETDFIGKTIKFQSSYQTVRSSVNVNQLFFFLPSNNLLNLTRLIIFFEEKKKIFPRENQLCPVLIRQLPNDREYKLLKLFRFIATPSKIHSSQRKIRKRCWQNFGPDRNEVKKK